VGAFGIVYNLVRMREDTLVEAEPRSARAAKQRGEPRQSRRKAAVAAGESGAVTMPERSFPEINWRPLVFGAAAALMLVVMGNFVWVLKYASAFGIGGKGFYEWVAVQGLTNNEPRADGAWYPTEYFGFFDASRIIPLRDDPLDQNDFYVITEFPMFSFVLGDIHPHVMALPFVLLAVGLALVLYRSDEPLDITYWLQKPLMLLATAVVLGALAFINTWDIATMAFLLVAAVFVANWLSTRSVIREGGRPSLGALSRDDIATLAAVAAVNVPLMVLLIALLTPGLLITLGLIVVNLAWLVAFGVYLSSKRWPDVVEAAVQTVSFALPLVMLAVVIYAPFYRSFTSQADGILPVVTREGIDESGTRPLHAFLYWGPLFAAVLPFLAASLLAARDRIVRRDLLIAGAVPVVIIVAWAALFAFMKAIGDEDVKPAYDFFTQIGDRGTGWITAILFGAAVGAALLALWLEVTSDNREASIIFALLLTSTALLLVLGTEFFYVGDVFNVRMNTVFKLYYQAWLLLALAGGFALYHLVSTWKTSSGNMLTLNRVWAGLAAVALVGAALYPFGATLNRIRPYDGDGAQAVKRQTDAEANGLDGISRFPQGERDAIARLTKLAQGQDIVIAEAAGQSYTSAGRIAAATGAPGVLGWPGHEDQWRGGTAEARAGRFEDLEQLFRTTNLGEVRQIVDKYGITHIYVGDLERTTYGSVTGALEKFSEFPVAFQTDGVIVYRAEGIEEEASTTP
jgi:YYY domain-containing protein